MKKRIICLAVAATLCLAACGTGEEGTADPTGSVPTNGASGEQKDPAGNGLSGVSAHKEKGYVFEYGGVTVGIDMEAADIITALGEPLNYFEAASCAFEGLDKMYTYASFEVDTYEMDGKDYISSILFKDDMVSTKEGVSLFMSKADMLAAYGEAYTEEYGMLVYEKDGMKLKFILTGDEITSIEYATTVLDEQ